ncbi:tRNA adenosine(34) deaminase TadA [Lagierella massiliensis]|uniref:tRNA adenosine(34) deaminase TadA n=1 Tax=Lagierella massiliensis TaxID=1689303 RepID=UPI0006D82E1E|nr:tRNA adenosine(34) deaminase TadA [Lagierella massiliensis]
MEDKKIIFMKEALKEAERAFELKEVPVGCVIVKDDEVIARAHNLVESLQNPLKHAELIAIEKASEKIKSWRLIDCELYVTLEPCAMCASAMVYSRIKKVYFGAYDIKRGFVGSVDNILLRPELNHRVSFEGGILKEESLNLMQNFFKDLRKS